MNKQELIDKAVEDLNGSLISISNYGLDGYILLRHKSGMGYSLAHVDSYAAEENLYFCTKDEFEQRARELGWCNGYKYGVEYETNGKKPDLPFSAIKLELKNIHFGTVKQSCDSDFVKWENVKSFRIVDESYKPVEQKENKLESHQNEPKTERSRTLMSVYFGGTDEVFKPLPFRVPAGKVLRCYLEDVDSKPANVEPEKSWHEKGDLPPVGVECEWSTNGGHNWYKTKLIFSDNTVFLTSAYQLYKIDDPDVLFRPLKTERERFVEAAVKLNKAHQWTAAEFAAAMYDAGFKAPDSTT